MTYNHGYAINFYARKKRYGFEVLEIMPSIHNNDVDRKFNEIKIIAGYV